MNFLVAFLLFAVSVFVPVYGEDDILSWSLKWHSTNQKEILAELKEGQFFEKSAPIINSLGLMIELNDGAVLYEVSPTVCIALIAKPMLTLSWFEKHPGAFDTWLKFISEGFFRAETEREFDELSNLRESVISALRAYLSQVELLDQDRSKIAGRVLKTFEASVVSKID
jgi:hypothetical protein